MYEVWLMNEKRFFDNYDFSKYEKPSVAADMVVFTVSDISADSPKKSIVKKMKIMLIKRGDHPYKGLWALPGGFLNMNETIEECAERELREETGLSRFYLRQFRTYSQIDRDPRGRIISCAYIALINNSEDIVRSDTDAADARWFDLTVTETEHGFLAQINDNDNTFIGFEVYESNDRQEPVNIYGKLAFDHITIISDAIRYIRSGFNTSEHIFSLLPEKFSIPQMQSVYALIMGKSVSKEVIHRLYDKKITKTAFVDGGQHKRAVLYQKNNNL